MNINKVKFLVDENNRVVVATIKHIRHDAIHEFNNKFLIHAGSDFYFDIGSDKCQKFLMPYSLKAIAHCHPDDTFDVEKGKKIALDRLIDKYHDSLDRHVLNIASAFDKALCHVDEYFDKRYNMEDVNEVD